MLVAVGATIEVAVGIGVAVGVDVGVAPGAHAPRNSNRNETAMHNRFIGSSLTPCLKGAYFARLQAIYGH